MEAVGAENLRRIGKERVQIVAGPAGRQGQPARVNIVRTLFKGGNCFSKIPERSDKADGQNRLARTAAKR